MNTKKIGSGLITSSSQIPALNDLASIRSFELIFAQYKSHTVPEILAPGTIFKPYSVSYILVLIDVVCRMIQDMEQLCILIENSAVNSFGLLRVQEKGSMVQFKQVMCLGILQDYVAQPENCKPTVPLFHHNCLQKNQLCINVVNLQFVEQNIKYS